MLEANFWQDKDNSKKVIKEKKLFEDLLNTYKLSIDNLSDLNDLSELALEEKNEPIQKEVLLNIKELRTLVKKNEVKCFCITPLGPILYIFYPNQKPTVKDPTAATYY